MVLFLAKQEKYITPLYVCKWHGSTHRGGFGTLVRVKKQPAHTDIQLKTLSRRIEVFNRKIIMISARRRYVREQPLEERLLASRRRDPDIFCSENIRNNNAQRRCLSNET